MVNLDEMALFARVAREKSFIGAARALGVPASTVSRKVARLEGRLGTRLLQRTSRKVSLTEEGAAYHERCERIVADAEEADRLVTSGRDAIRGTLRVSAPRLFGDVFLPAIVSEYLGRHPGVKVQVLLADRKVDLVAEGLDVAIRVGRMSDSTHLAARRMGTSQTHHCASPEYLRRRGAPASPEALSEHACITTGEGRGGTLWHFTEGGQVRSLRIHGRLVANSFFVARDAAIAGHGIALLPAFACAASIRSGALAVTLEAFTPPPTPLFAVFPKSPEVPARLRAFLDLLQRRGAAAPWTVGLRADEAAG